MMTGYTHAVGTGEITTLQGFALSCAGAFGVDARDGELPTNCEEDLSCFDEGIATATARLAELSELSPARCELDALAAYEVEALRYVEEFRRTTAERERCHALLTLTTEWQPSPLLSPLRDFMLQQLATSLERSATPWEPPKRLTGAEWLAREVGQARWDLDYYERRRANAVANNARLAEWLAALRAELP